MSGGGAKPRDVGFAPNTGNARRCPALPRCAMCGRLIGTVAPRLPRQMIGWQGIKHFESDGPD